MAKENKKIIRAVVIFLAIWIGGNAIAVILGIKNGLLPAFFFGAAIAIWYYKGK